jgi:hypothetical protein
MRILSAVIGAVVGAIVGLILGLFVATVAGGDNDLAVGFLLIYCAPLGSLIGLVLGIVAGLFLIQYLRKVGPTRRKIMIAAVLVGLAAGIGGMLWTIKSRNEPPSDQKLLANFEHHEATFNELIEMLKVDQKLIRVDVDWTDPRDPDIIGVSPERISTYRRMLKDARVPRGFQSRGSTFEVDFYYWGIGSAISSDTTKGYAYMEIPPIGLRDSLDGYQPHPKDGDTPVRAYRHIRGNWYLFYEYIPG